jgi:hypothetical protein
MMLTKLSLPTSATLAEGVSPVHYPRGSTATSTHKATKKAVDE